MPKFIKEDPPRRIASLALAMLAIVITGLVVHSAIQALMTGSPRLRQPESAATQSSEGSGASPSADVVNRDDVLTDTTDAPSATDNTTSQQPQPLVGETTPVQDPWVVGGLFTTGNAKLDQYVKEMCDGHSSPGASAEENAFSVFDYIAGTPYKERVNNQSPWGETWDVEYALQYFEEDYSGNCYNFAAVLEYVLKYFGYADAEAEPCVVSLASGDWGDHGLVFVTNIANGEACLVDAARSAEGWMIGKDAYSYDVRNIAQNPTVVGNVDVLFDSDEPIPITPAPGLEPN